MYLFVEDGRDVLKRSKMVVISIRVPLEVRTQRNIVKNAINFQKIKKK